MARTVLIEYTKPSLYRCGDFRVVAGKNEVRADIWEAVKDTVGVQKRIVRGEIIVKSPVAKTKSVKNEGIPVDAPSPDDLSAHNLIEAKAIIKKTVDYKLLKKWEAVEKRKGVLKALARQLSEFAGVPEDEKEAEEVEPVSDEVQSEETDYADDSNT